MQQELFDYLEQQLTCEGMSHRFKRTGPHTLFYQDDVDTVFIYIANNQFTIITDGDFVVNQIESKALTTSKDYFDSTEEWIEYLDEEYLQLVLHRF